MKPRIFIFSNADDECDKIINRLIANLRDKAIVTPWREKKGNNDYEYAYRTGGVFLNEINYYTSNYDYFVFIINGENKNNRSVKKTSEKPAIISKNLLFELGLVYGKQDKTRIYVIVNSDYQLDDKFSIYTVGIINMQYSFKYSTALENSIKNTCTEIIENANEAIEESQYYDFEQSLSDLTLNINSEDGIISKLENIEKKYNNLTQKDAKNVKYINEVCEYLKRILYQKLVYTSYKISDNVISSNLWVNVSNSDDEQSLVSEDREGYFMVDQLISITGDKIDYRSKKWKPFFKDNSLGKKIPSIASEAIYKKNKIIYRKLTKNRYNIPETNIGATHIVGIPLFPETMELECINKHTPLSITIDLRIEIKNPKVEALIKEMIEEKARLIMQIGKELSFKICDLNIFKNSF